MAQFSLDEIKSQRHFYRNLYRRLSKWLLFLFGLALLQCVLIFYFVTTKSDPQYYTTNGVTAPLELTTLATPNYRSEPLLVNDRPDEMTQAKVIPD